MAATKVGSDHWKSIVIILSKLPIEHCEKLKEIRLKVIVLEETLAAEDIPLKGKILIWW